MPENLSRNGMYAHDAHPDWGLVIAGEKSMEVTKNGKDFESIGWPFSYDNNEQYKGKFCIAISLSSDSL